jgi:hypothetical protein
MNVILLNWSNGENDPITYFNKQLAIRFADFGVKSTIIEIDDNLGNNLMAAKNNHADFAITWQGFASNIIRDGGTKIFWEEIELPLFCIHGDHPCHMLTNHSTDSDYVTHFYSSGSYASYANKYIPRKKPAIFYMLPNFFSRSSDPCHGSGDFFVFPKNLDDVTEAKALWSGGLPQTTSDFMLDAASEIERCYEEGDLIDHHEVIDKCLTDEIFQAIRLEMKIDDEQALFHMLHASLDKVYRNTVSQRVVQELNDFPLIINGRGWNRYRAKPSPHHEFHDFGTVEEGGKQFSSRYGIIDVVPTRHFLHDRSFRAIAIGSGFLSNSRYDFKNLMGSDFRELFYSGKPGSLSDLAEQVMVDPRAHIERVREFGRCYDQMYSFYSFYLFMYSLVMSK